MAKKVRARMSNIDNIHKALELCNTAYERQIVRGLTLADRHNHKIVKSLRQRLDANGVRYHMKPGRYDGVALMKVDGNNLE